jgi:hypothetical protein
MRRPLVAFVALALSGLALPACSALGLADLPQADCVQGSGGVSGDAFCASLSTRIVPPACHTWQCNEQTHHCEQLPTDDDEDGAPTMMCAPSGVTPDCDDASDHNVPGGTETCDGLDENCNGIPDDGAIMPSPPSPITTINAAPDQLALTYQPDADEAFLMARYTNTFRAVTLATTATPVDLAFSQTGMGAILPQMSDGAVTPLGGASYALVTRRTVTAGCQQWALFPVQSATGPVILRTNDESLMPACPGGTQQLSAPAIAAHDNGTSAGNTLLVGWLAAADATRSCGASAEAPVTIAGASFDNRPAAINHVGTDVRTLGTSVDNGPPVLLALDDAFVVAYARADMTIAVHLVTVDPATRAITVAASPEYVEPAGATVPQGVTLALGPTTTGGATSIALGYYTGCGGSNPITVRMLARSGAAITGSSAAATDLGTGLARSRIQIAYQPRGPGEWIVGWRSASGLAVQRLFHDGAAEGDPFDVVSSNMVSAFVVEPLSSGPLYRAVVVDGTAVNQVTFGCGP